MVATIVGKGPSAVHADDFLRECPESDVVSINEALKVINSRRYVDYLFFTDVELIELARADWHRVRTFVCPTVLHRRLQRSSLTAADVDGLPLERCQQYPYQVNFNFDRETLREWIRDRRPTLQCTSMAAHSWLAYRGYETIRLVGIDGGQQRAANFQQASGPGPYSQYRAAQELLADVLRQELGVITEWFAPTS